MTDASRPLAIGAGTINSMFSESSNINITGGTFTQANVEMLSRRPSEGFVQLRRAVSPSAFHNSGDRFEPPKCHPNTRVEILQRLMDWTLSSEDRNVLMMWLFGLAGVGKSAIAQTLAERLYASKRLLASFFFSRSDPSRNHPRNLIATIAYQICLNIPEAYDNITSAVEHDPFIFTRSLETQLTTLIVEPLQQLSRVETTKGGQSSPRVIIIDGLDECQDPNAQSSLLTAISNVLRQNVVPLLFLIASRPETQISAIFNSHKLAHLHKRLALDDVYQASADIRLFLNEKFNEINATHPRKAYLDPAWPLPEVVEGLVRKASGQFIYASVVMKFVSSRRHRPNERLDIIQGLRPVNLESPYTELDTLYRHLFSSLDNAPAALLILALVHFGVVPLGGEISYIEDFLSMKPGDVEIILDDLISVVNIDVHPKATDLSMLTIPHASLMDFLTDETRSREFYINPPVMYTAFAQQCFIHLRNLTAHPNNRYMLHQAYTHLIHYCSLSVTAQLRDYIIQFSLPEVYQKCQYPPLVETFIGEFLSYVSCVKLEDASDIYNYHLAALENYWASKLHLYFEDPHLYFFLASYRAWYTPTSPPIFLDPSPMCINRLSRMSLKQRQIDDSALILLPLGRFSLEHDIYRSLVIDFIDSIAHKEPAIGEKLEYSCAVRICLTYLRYRTYRDVINEIAHQGTEMRRNSPWRWRTEPSIKRRKKRVIRRRCARNGVDHYYFPVPYRCVPDKAILYPRFQSYYFKANSRFNRNKSRTKLVLDVLQGLLEISKYSEPLLELSWDLRALVALSPNQPPLVKCMERALGYYLGRWQKSTGI